MATRVTDEGFTNGLPPPTHTIDENNPNIRIVDAHSPTREIINKNHNSDSDDISIAENRTVEIVNSNTENKKATAITLGIIGTFMIVLAVLFAKPILLFIATVLILVGLYLAFSALIDFCMRNESPTNQAQNINEHDIDPEVNDTDADNNAEDVLEQESLIPVNQMQTTQENTNSIDDATYNIAPRYAAPHKHAERSTANRIKNEERALRKAAEALDVDEGYSEESVNNTFFDPNANSELEYSTTLMAYKSDGIRKITTHQVKNGQSRVEDTTISYNTDEARLLTNK